MTRYLIQAAGGQLQLFNRARPIDDVVRDTRTDPQVRSLLAEVPSIKQYGEKMGLKATANYRHYVDLRREAVVWVVAACRALKFEAKEWTFPVVGSFPYLGWFNKQDALDYGRSLEGEGWDVEVRGASAYSTLGWFKDPILSTMLGRGEGSLAGLVNVVLHESVHATVYINGQSYFNESLASFVADRMSDGYFEEKEASGRASLLKYRQDLQTGQARAKRLHEVYEVLEKIYKDSSLSDEKKTAAKRETLEAVVKELGLSRSINNATLIQFKTYHSSEEGFSGLWLACGKNWTRFLQAVATLTDKDFGSPQREEFASVLAELGRRECAPTPGTHPK